jgi:hypothetical protein
MLGSKTVTFGPRAVADGAALAMCPPVLALRSATRATARDRIVVDRTRTIEIPPFR